jgi:hypothetical protein
VRELPVVLVELREAAVAHAAAGGVAVRVGAAVVQDGMPLPLDEEDLGIGRLVEADVTLLERRAGGEEAAEDRAQLIVAADLGREALDLVGGRVDAVGLPEGERGLDVERLEGGRVLGVEAAVLLGDGAEIRGRGGGDGGSL